MNIQMRRGDTTVFDVAVTRYNPITGRDEPVTTMTKAWFTAKKTRADADAQAIISYNSLDDNVNCFITSNVVRVIIAAADTATLLEKWFEYDVQIRETDGTITTVQSGRLEILKDATIINV